jgi:hypothetical protein
MEYNTTHRHALLNARSIKKGEYFCASGRNYLPLFIVSLLLFFNVAIGHAQDTTQHFLIIKTKAGRTYTGQFIKEDTSSITIAHAQLGRLTIDKVAIVSRDSYTAPNEALADSSHSSHYSRFFVNTNGLGLKAHEGYYQNSLVFFNKVGYGITDRLTVGGGIAFLGGPVKLWATANYNLKLSENARLNVGALVSNWDRAFTVVPSTSFTLGNKSTNFTIGYGYEHSSGGIILLNGLVGVGKGIYIITENYFVANYSGGFNILGVRFSQKKYAFDIGVFRFASYTSIPALPYAGLSVPF